MKRLLILTATLLTCLSLTACGIGSNAESQTNGRADNASSSASDTVSNIEELPSIGRWGNLALNLSYQIPVPMGGRGITGSSSATYLQGHSFYYVSNWSIFVETLLEGTADLQTLPLQIAQEKQSEAYASISEKIWLRYMESIEHTEPVTVAGYDAVYFESAPITAETFSGGSEMTMKYLGYSFMADDLPVCVYGEIDVDSEETREEDLRGYLQYVISTIQPYNGEAFVELDPDCDWGYLSYLNGRVSRGAQQAMGQDTFQISLPDNHVLNGLIGVDTFDAVLYFHEDSKQTYGLMTPGLELADIFETVRRESTVEHDFDSGVFPVAEWGSDPAGQFELLTTAEPVTLAGIDMLRYVGYTKNTLPASTEDDTVTPYGDYFVVYTFQFEGRSFYYQYRLSEGVFKIAEPAWDNYLKMTELNADTYIRTFMTIEQAEAGISAVKEQAG